VSEQLAPHQQRLAEFLGKKPDPGPADGLRSGWLRELRERPSVALDGLERTIREHGKDAATEKMLARLAMQLSEDHRMAEPDGPGTAFCDYCGSTQDLEETDSLGAGDVPCPCHGMIMRPCKDTGACIARREERYPPSLDRVPDWVFGAQAAITDEDARRMIVAACGAALGDFLELMQQPADDDVLELSGQQPHFPGWISGQYGAYNARGDWLTLQPQVNFNWSHWAHTIRGGAHHGHLISGGARWGAPAAAPPAQAGPAQGGARQIPETGNPPGVEEALHGGHGVDLPVTPHAQPGHAGAVARPALPRDRYGNRRYPRRRR
jgi:hypothetical protein